MAQYKLINDKGQTATIEADNFVTDGGGTRFFDANGVLLAAFGCGQLQSILPTSLVFGSNETEE